MKLSKTYIFEVIILVLITGAFFGANWFIFHSVVKALESATTFLVCYAVITWQHNKENKAHSA